MTCFLVSFTTNFGQTPETSKAAPKIDRVVPGTVFPKMFIRVIGSGLYQENNQARYIFLQASKRFETISTSGGREENGLWGATVEVPFGLAAGACEIEVQIGSRKSELFPLLISPAARPPKLTKLSAWIVRAGDYQWLDGIGFARGQIISLSDSEGQKYSEEISGVSAATNVSFTVPKNFYSGIATLKIREPLADGSQFSNELRFEIRQGPIPVLFYNAYAKPISSGQWVDLATNDSRPLYLATMAELRLTQGSTSVTYKISNFRKIHFAIPKSFRPGKMQMKSRTWIKSQVSEWSPPTDLDIVGKPRFPVVRSVEMLPTRAEGKLVQNGRTLKTVPVHLGVLPRVYLPQDTPVGDLEILVRSWTKQNHTEWKRVAKFDRLDITKYVNPNGHPEYHDSKFYTMLPFYDRVFFENGKHEFYDIMAGNDLAVYGNFFVRSSTDLKFILEDGERKISLYSEEHEDIGSALIHLPRQLRPGIWRIWIGVRGSGKMRRVPIKLRVN